MDPDPNLWLRQYSPVVVQQSHRRSFEANDKVVSSEESARERNHLVAYLI
jgi:hypothetical protein